MRGRDDSGGRGARGYATALGLAAALAHPGCGGGEAPDAGRDRVDVTARDAGLDASGDAGIDAATGDVAEGDGDRGDGDPGDVPADASASCLPVRTADLLELVATAPYASRTGGPMAVIAPDASAWRAARAAAVAWARGDCGAFADAAGRMGYRAAEVIDAATGRRHWVLTDATRTYNGVFVFRAPSERAAARPLVIDSPHWGYDFTDDRAVRAYRDLDAVAFMQNTAHRCNLADCSGCTPITNYACGGCVRTSDVAHSLAQLYVAVYDGLEAERDDLHLQYHGAGAGSNVAGCAGTAHISQASTRALTAAADDGTYPNRVWRALEARLGGACVCYHQRETGCRLSGAGSVQGRRTNEEAGGSGVDECTQAPPALSGRFVHFEGYQIPVATVIEALAEAVPPPAR